MRAKILISILTLVFSSSGLQSAFAQMPDEGFLEGDTFEGEEQGYFVVEDDQSVPEEYPANMRGEVDVSYFYDKLSPYGEWIWTPEYGWVWHPLEVWEDWRPYTYGRWAYTQYGWTWSSHFAWGWAPFHYGSWAFLDYIGWVWVPGRIWAPAWVMWRYSDMYVGWSPILAGYSYWYGWAYYPVYYSHWTFIHWNRFCDPHPHHHYIARRGVRDAFRHTYFPRRCRDRSGISCHRGLSKVQVSKHTKVPVKSLPAVNLAAKPEFARIDKTPRKKSLGVQGGQLNIFRPKLPKSTPGLHSSSKPGRIRKTIDLGEVQSAPRPRAPTSKVRPPEPGIGRIPSSPQVESKPRTPQVLERRKPSPGSFIHPRQPKTHRPSIPKSTIRRSAPKTRRAPGIHRVTPSTPKVRSAPKFRSAPKSRSFSPPKVKSSPSPRSAPKRSSSSSSRSRSIRRK